MLAVDSTLDAIFLGAFFFGLVFVVVSLFAGSIDIGGDGDGDFGPVNLSTILAFVAWFGGIGYLVHTSLGGLAIVSLLAAVVGGVIGAAAIYWLLARFIAPADRVLDAADFELPGTLARVTSSIREGGTGEVVFEQQGVRQVSAARSADGSAIARGLEVVILRANHGVAMVQPWEALMADHQVSIGTHLDEIRDPERVAQT